MTNINHRYRLLQAVAMLSLVALEKERAKIAVYHPTEGLMDGLGNPIPQDPQPSNPLQPIVVAEPIHNVQAAMHAQVHDKPVKTSAWVPSKPIVPRYNGYEEAKRSRLEREAQAIKARCAAGAKIFRSARKKR